MDGKVPPSAFRNKVVVIGSSATVAAGLPLDADVRRARQMPGAEVQANIAETALHGFPLRSVWNGWNFVLIVLFGLIAPLREPAATRLALAGARARRRRAVRSSRRSSRSTTGKVIVVTYPLLALGPVVDRRARRRVPARGVRARAHARHVLALRARGRRRPGARARRRRAAARRRARRGDGDVHRPARVHDLLGGSRRRRGDRPAQRLPRRDQRRGARARRHARLVPRRRAHGRVRCAAAAGRPRRPRARGRARDARGAAARSTTRSSARRASSAASRWGSA